MKRLGKIFLLTTLLLGSMYTTNKMVELTREQDPIMMKIESSKEKYEIEPVNAIIEKDQIIPGIYGTKISKQDSYNHMKKYGSYNESLTVIKEKKPDISTEDNYEYTISKGNSNKRGISLIFKTKEKNDLKEVLNILKRKEVEATFFLDGNLLETTSSIIKNNLDQEYEILSFNNAYGASFITSSASYLESITKQKTKYCYLETENKNFLKYCIKEKKHTIKPKYILKENLYKEVKNSLENGNIYSLEITEEVLKELDSTIQYIKSKGYKLVTLETLLSEQQEK